MNICGWSWRYFYDKSLGTQSFKWDKVIITGYKGIIFMSQLFIVYLGGSATTANIELHDIQFVIGDKIEDTYEQLRNN